MINLELVNRLRSLEVFLACLVEVHLSSLLFLWFRDELRQNHQTTLDNLPK